MPETQIPIALEDLYRIIGEREVVRFYQQKEIDRLMAENDRLQKALDGKVSGALTTPAR